MCFYCRKLQVLHQDHVKYQLNMAVCLTNLKDYQEALKILYKLSYEHPDDHQITRVLAWALTGNSQYEPALKKYEELLAVEKPEPDDMLHAAYCHWFDHRVGEAVILFRRYAKQENVRFDAVREFHNESDFISSHGVAPIEVQLMIDLL